MFAGKKSAQIREILISESAWEEMTCLFAPSLTKSAKPFSIKTAIAICALCTLCLSAAFSGATWYVAQHEKEASLRFYARAFLDMKKITEESMRKLPKSDQQNIKLKLDEIDSRKP